MQFRCFRCGFVFSNGLPPLEAMSIQQADVIGAQSPEVNYSILDGTIYEGLSPYNFCAFCIHVIQEFPKAHEPDYWAGTHDVVQEVTRNREIFSRHRTIKCSCGESIITHEPDDQFLWVRANRKMVLHRAKVNYPEGDFSLAEELLEKDI